MANEIKKAKLTAEYKSIEAVGDGENAPYPKFIVTITPNKIAGGSMIRVSHDAAAFHNDLRNIYVTIHFAPRRSSTDAEGEAKGENDPANLVDPKQIWDRSGQYLVISNEKIPKVVWHIRYLAREFTAELRVPELNKDALGKLELIITSERPLLEKRPARHSNNVKSLPTITYTLQKKTIEEIENTL